MGEKNLIHFLLVHKKKVKFKMYSMSKGTILELLVIFHLNLFHIYLSIM